MHDKYQAHTQQFKKRRFLNLQVTEKVLGKGCTWERGRCNSNEFLVL